MVYAKNHRVGGIWAITKGQNRVFRVLLYLFVTAVTDRLQRPTTLQRCFYCNHL